MPAPWAWRSPGSSSASSARISTAGSASSSASRCSRSRPACWHRRPISPSSPLLRIAQGLCMASAFALTLAYLGEQCSAMDAGGAFAAYITGNVASNLIGRLISAAVADTLRPGLEFLLLRRCSISPARCWSISPSRGSSRCMRWAIGASPLAAMLAHWRNPRAARRLRHRLLHPVRLHRHLHLRQFRAGARRRCRSA